MNSKKTVLVAMSGGVDSSVAAALLRDSGYRVIGATMQIWPKNVDTTANTCCGVNAIEDARKVAYKLGIPHYVLNFRDIFARRVITDFCEEYRRGRTPNPCIRCNQFIKFGAFLEMAAELGAHYIATGHHARVGKDRSGLFYLKKGADAAKDQSYFLYTLTQEQLKRTLMPVGELTKAKVREIAARLELPVASKPGSQEICFIPDDDYAKFLKDMIPGAAEPGPILDDNGNILGQHRGVLYYTIGQHKRLGISSPEPLYVIAIQPERNAIIVGGEKELFGTELVASRLTGIATNLEGPITLSARIRYRHPEAEVEVTPVDADRVQVKFKEPQKAITPGQAIVFYQSDRVVGGGTIEKTKRPATAPV